MTFSGFFYDSRIMIFDAFTQDYGEFLSVVSLSLGDPNGVEIGMLQFGHNQTLVWDLYREQND